MSKKRSGRKIYCIVKDKYGNEIKTDVVTLTKGNVAKITTQLSSVSVHKGEVAKVRFTASGDGRAYTWYY